jgi:hypothetical protein
MIVCEGCGDPLPPPAATGRPRRFCAATCRARAHRRRHHTADHRGDGWAVYVGDCRLVLPTLADGSVHSIVTSLPYWTARDYSSSVRNRCCGSERQPPELYLHRGQVHIPRRAPEGALFHVARGGPSTDRDGFGRDRRPGSADAAAAAHEAVAEGLAEIKEAIWPAASRSGMRRAERESEAGCFMRTRRMPRAFVRPVGWWRISTTVADGVAPG